jgi:tetratricopeptide (TPR) repeat protein
MPAGTQKAAAPTADSIKTTPVATDSATGAAAGDEEATEGLPAGKGNVESLAHYATGEGLEEAGQHDEAMEEFYKSVVADPGNERTAKEVGQWLLDQHHPERAVTLLSLVAQNPAVSATILTLLAKAQLQSNQTAAALATSQRAIARRPDMLASYESKLVVLVQTGKLPEALKTLDQAARHIANKPADLVGLAKLYTACLSAKAKETDPVRTHALALLNRAAAMKISSVGVRQDMADNFAALGETKKAGDLYAQLIAEVDYSPTLRNGLRQRYGELLMDLHDVTNASAQFQAIVRDDRMRYPLAWYYLGLIAQATGELTDAADDFSNALRVFPGMELAYYRLALVLADMDQNDAALRILEAARGRFQDSFDAQFFNALVNLQIKDFDEAVKHFSNAETIARTNSPGRLDAGFYFQIGAACERDHLFKRAEDYLQKCIDMSPDNAEALNYLGFMWADRGEKLAKARVYIEKACKAEPTNAAYLDSMGWVLYKLRLSQEALPWMIKAVDLSPDPDPTILDHLGDVYMSLHQTSKALENWKKSYAIEPNDDVKKKLQSFDAGAT